MIRKTTNNTIWASGRQLALLIPLFLLGGCTAQEDVTEAQQGAYGTLAVDEVVTLADGASTRADATPAVTAPPTGSSIGVFRQADTYYTTASNNVKYTLATDGKWKVDPTGADILLGANDSRALLYAYYPNNGKIAVAADNVSVTMGSRAYDTDYDLSYMAAGSAVATDAGGLVYNFHPGVSFTMKRAYTQLAVSLTRGADYGGVGAVTAVSLTLQGGGKLYSSGTQNIATGAYTAGTADVDKITYTVPANTKITTASKTAIVSQLLPPGKNGTVSSLTLTVTVDGVTTNATISTDDLALEAGKRYVVKATINYNGLAAFIKTTDWDSQTAWNEEATFVPEIPPVDLGLPFVIAPGNLTAVSNGSGYTYSIAEDQGYYSGDGSGGDYYCWNTLYPNLDNEMQTAWDDARDACRQIDGGEWYTPSIEQWRLMLGKGSVWGTYAAGSGTKNGYYIGTSSIPSEAEQNKFLFLPASGVRYVGNSWSGDDNTMAYYWSSTVDDAGYNAAFAIFFVEPEISEQTTDRYGGFSLRCVKDKPIEHAIDINLDFYIADGNLMATSDGAGGYTYAFAEEQGYYGGDGSQTDYFCWNTLEPTGQIAQSSWDDARDPCRKIGDGNWYTPTQAQCQALVGAGNVWGKDIYTMQDGTTKNGRYFGTTTVPSKADQNKYVFLPAAGYRYGSSYLKAGTHGYYWSATLYASSTDEAHDLYFYSSGCLVDSYRRNYGFPLRCVRDK